MRGAISGRERRGGTFGAYLRLVRVAGVPTAMADVAAGHFLAVALAGGVSGGVGATVLLHSVPPFLLGLLASTCLYLAGMALNDVLDREADALRRPDRPIPSGRVDVPAAALLASFLVAAGVAAGFAAGAEAGFVALGLAALAALYDSVLKEVPLAGPLAMGGCRSLNLFLGAATGGVGAPPSVGWAAVALGLYVAGVTALAREEGRAATPWRLSAAALGAAGAVAIVGGAKALGLAGPARMGVAGPLAAALFAATSAHALLRAYEAGAEEGVRRLLASIVLLDATALAVAGEPMAAAVVALGWPLTVVLGRIVGNVT